MENNPWHKKIIKKITSVSPSTLFKAGALTASMFIAENAMSQENPPATKSDAQKVQVVKHNGTTITQISENGNSNIVIGKVGGKNISGDKVEINYIKNSNREKSNDIDTDSMMDEDNDYEYNVSGNNSNGDKVLGTTTVNTYVNGKLVSKK